MGVYKKYKEQNNFDKPLKRPSSTRDTTISNMMGYGENNKSVNTDHKDYGKIKSKGGIKKHKTIRNSK